MNKEAPELNKHDIKEIEEEVMEEEFAGEIDKITSAAAKKDIGNQSVNKDDLAMEDQSCDKKKV